MTLSPLAHTRCPLCAEPNHCAPAASGTFNTACWCQSVSVSESVLAKIPEALQQQACLCPRCAAQEESAPPNL